MPPIQPWKCVNHKSKKKNSRKHQKCRKIYIYYACFIIFCQRFGYPNGEQEIQPTSRRWKFGMDKIYIYLICWSTLGTGPNLLPLSNQNWRYCLTSVLCNTYMQGIMVWEIRQGKQVVCWRSRTKLITVILRFSLRAFACFCLSFMASEPVTSVTAFFC